MHNWNMNFGDHFSLFPKFCLLFSSNWFSQKYKLKTKVSKDLPFGYTSRWGKKKKIVQDPTCRIINNLTFWLSILCPRMLVYWSKEPLINVLGIPLKCNLCKSFIWLKVQINNISLSFLIIIKLIIRTDLKLSNFIRTKA